MKTCKQCKGDIPHDAKKCQHCGSNTNSLFSMKSCLVLVGIFIFFGIIGALTDEGGSTSTSSTPQPQTIEAKQEAQKKFDELMKLSKTAGLVTSYEFSNKARVVYVSNIWYGQEVAFKKDFMASIAMSMHTVTGYRWFKVRDFRSNEVVGEVTAFGGSLEVYK